MKILLIDPFGTVQGINTGLGCLAASLKDIEADLQVLDFCNQRQDVDERLVSTLKKKYDIIGFSIKAFTMVNALKLAQRCKAISPESILIAGGPQVTIQQEEFLKENPVFDYILCGEGEYSFPDFARFIKGEKKISEVCGLGYRENGDFRVNPTSFIQNLDELPFPDYSAFADHEILQQRYPLVTSRGCPYNCIYCSVHLVSGKKFRKRSPENVVAELIQAKAKYHIKHFEMVDDTFTQDKERAKEICRLLIKENLGLSWKCANGIRADRIDRELLQLMKAALCTEIWFGIESLNPDIFNSIQKGESIEQIIQTIKIARDTGIKVGAFFIIGLPGSSYEKDLYTIREAKKLGLKISTWSFATPMPRTQLWDWANQNSHIINDYKKISFFKEPKCSFETADYSEQERIHLFYTANLAFFRYDTLIADKNQVNKNIYFILRTIWKYDRKRMPTHLIKLMSQFMNRQGFQALPGGAGMPRLSD